MLIFLDTEYTGLGQPNPKLISLALVPADGSEPFYAEIEMGDGWGKHDCSEFVLAEVLPVLKGDKHQVTRQKLKEKLLSWLATMPRSIQVACDSETDFRFLRDALGNDWPEKLDRQYFDLRPLLDTSVFERSTLQFYQNDQPMHNALADAKALREGWQAWSDAQRSLDD